VVSDVSERFAALPTAAKLLLILTAVLLPIGIALVWIAADGTREANTALRERHQEQTMTAARQIESLIARNSLALRIAANGALAGGEQGACERAQRALSIAPAIEQGFQIHSTDGRLICQVEDLANHDLRLVAPGDFQLQIDPNAQALLVRVGVIGGMMTGSLEREELLAAARNGRRALTAITLLDHNSEMQLLAEPQQEGSGARQLVTDWPIAGDRLTVRTSGLAPEITTADRLVLLLPLLMWVAAALITWSLVSRLLVQPLRRLQRAVIRFQPGDSPETLPRKLGPATEIQEVRDSFARAISRVEESEHEMAGALEGQRRLVREVHHRVKNNLQVVASLLNIHGRSAETPEAKAAYASIARRVGALSVVHRNHFAELEESRGIALRPLISELAAELRASAPPEARGMTVELDVEAAYTTQDVAVAVSFLVTEIVEFAMLRRPQDSIEVSLRRTSELTARLVLGSPVLAPGDDEADRVQFERIVGGLAKQLRSTLERKLGRYSVDLPVFPPT